MTQTDLYIAQLVKDAPPLSKEQLNTLTSIFASQPPLQAVA